jgi:peptidoglycan hydrolase CwlO-like protein
MQEREISLKDMLFTALRGWRKIVIFAIICAVLFGSFTAVTRVMDMNDPKMLEKWNMEYEVAYGSYWAEINNLDRQIADNDRLASQAELEIERLDIKKADYEGNLADLEAKIEYYKARIEDCKDNIEQLKLEKEKLEYYLEYRKEQNKNSLLMAIDPYNVNVYESFLRIDSGYEILPGNTYQNQDPTPEIIETYRLLVNNTEFYEKMITELGLKTEVRYLTEIISVGGYGMNSIRIRVISDNKVDAEKIGNYIAAEIKAVQTNVIASIADHELVEYNTNSYSVVDLNVYTQQHGYIQEERNYEASLRDVDMSILTIESDIRGIDTDIRHFLQDIEDIKIAISELPIEKKSLEDKISEYHDANFEFKSERIKLLEKPEPQYGGYTVLSVITGFIKFAVIGGVVGALLAAIYVAVMGIINGKVLSSEQICGVVNTKFFGYWPKTGKKKFAFVDRWIDRMSGREVKGMTHEDATNLVLSNVSVEGNDKAKIMLCGGASKEIINEVACKIKNQLPDVEIICGTTIDVDSVVVRGIAECDAAILVEQLDKSGLNAVVQINEQLAKRNKSVLGVILN